MAGDQVSIIQSIKSPLGLLSLVVLVSDGILGIFAANAEGTERIILIVGMILIIMGIVVVVFFKADSLVGQSLKNVEEGVMQYDIFLAAPMASFGSDSDYKKGREMVMQVITGFKDHIGFKKIMYAGQDISTIESFEAPDVSVEEDFQSIAFSKYFVLILPHKLASSVLVEAGAALALRKPSIYFVRNREDLPFLLKEASQAFTYVKIYEYEEIRDIINLIRSSKLKLFPSRE